ncbi:MAG: MFS transporter [Hyphomicrobiales bacterium]|nr:MFS transporter [Hyphomicrobiales bacterium]
MHLPGAPQKEHGYLVSKPQAWLAFALSFLLMAFDFIDRQIVVSMFPHLKEEWGLSDQQLGALVSIVAITVALGTLPISLFVDNWSRVKGVVAMATVWSLATISCAFTGTYGQLLVARGFIGLGEAGYGPAAGALLSSVFPTRMRATIIGGFLAAATFGSVIGVILGGVIASRWGWKTAFGVVGVPGLLLAVLYLFVRDYRAPELVIDAPSKIHRANGIARELFRARSGIAAYLGSALQLVTTSTMVAWLPSYFNRVYGQPAERAGVWAAGIIVCATLGVVFWSIVADRLARRDLRWRMFTPAACCFATLIIFSVAFGALQAGPLQLALIALGGFLMAATTGPMPAVAIDVVHPALRSTAASMVTVAQNLFGLGIGPLIAGALSDRFGLQTAMALVSLSCGFAALVLVVGARTYRRDHDAVAGLAVAPDLVDAAPLAA